MKIANTYIVLIRQRSENYIWYIIFCKEGHKIPPSKCSSNVIVIRLSSRSRVYVPSPEPGWTRYGSNGHLKRRVKDYRTSVCMLYHRGQDLCRSRVCCSLYQSLGATEGLHDRPPAVGLPFFILTGLWLHRGLAGPDCAQLGCFGLAAHVCHPSPEPVGWPGYVLMALAKTQETKPNDANAFFKKNFWKSFLKNILH